MPLFLQLAIVFAVGGGLGWILARLSAKRPELSADGRLETELRQQLQKHQDELTTARDQLTRAAADIARAEAARDALVQTEATQQKMLSELRQQFELLSANALRQNTPQFLELAKATLATFQESAKGDLTQRQQAIATLLQPLQQQLETYQRRLQQSDATQSTALGEVKKQLESLAGHSQTLSSETLQLRRVLSSNQARGRWGEETLRRVVEAAGMSPHCDFTEQQQVDDKKPDLVVHLPGEHVIIVDAKVPDLDFLGALESSDAASRAQALTLHANKLKVTVRDLARKNYSAQYPHALDYVILFLPAESLFSAALEADRDLIVWAAEQQIMLATPTSLIALLRAVSVSWQQHAQTENARDIAATAQELYGRVAKFTEHFEKIRTSIDRAALSYNEAVGSYERMVRPSGDKLLKLSGGAALKELPIVESIETALRPPPVR